MERENPAAVLPWIARMTLMADRLGMKEQAIVWAEANGAPARAIRIMKNIGAGHMGDQQWGAALGDVAVAIGAFTDSLRTRSAFYRIAADNGFARLPLRTRAAILTLGVTAYMRGEGKAVRGSEIAAENHFLEVRSAAAMLVCSDELMANVSAAGQALFNRELKGAVADEVDADFLSLITDTNTPTFTSVGDDPEDAAFDLGRMLLAVNMKGDAAPYWIVSESVAKRASILALRGIDAFSAMSPTGGEILNLPALVSSKVTDGSIFLVNARGILAEADTIEIRTSNQALIDMGDPPTGDATTGAAAASISLFQTNGAALMAVATFGCELLRDDCVAVLEGVTWGGAMQATE